MANSPQARKRVRRNDRREDINRARVGRMRTYIRRVEAAVEAGDAKAAQEALKSAEPEIARGVTKGVLHKNTAARRVSRLTRRVKSLSS